MPPARPGPIDDRNLREKEAKVSNFSCYVDAPLRKRNRFLTDGDGHFRQATIVCIEAHYCFQSWQHRRDMDLYNDLNVSTPGPFHLRVRLFRKAYSPDLYINLNERPRCFINDDELHLLSVETPNSPSAET